MSFHTFPERGVISFDFFTCGKISPTAALDIFKNQVLQRAVVTTVQQQRELVKENPKQALSNIMSGLSDVDLIYDEDIQTYDDGETDRLAEWKERTRRRKMGDGLMGVPTSFSFINQAGIGWQPGELIAAFARPTIGKTWLCAVSYTHLPLPTIYSV